MNHPYNGAASYIYVNEHNHSEWEDQNPYSHMRSLMPMHSLQATPQQQLHQDKLSMELKMSMRGGEYGFTRSSLSTRWRSRTVAWRGTIKRRARTTFNNVGGLFKIRPLWVAKPRAPISGVR